MILEAVHRSLHILRCSHLFQTLWTKFNKRSLSPVGRGTVDHVVTLGLVVWGAKCGGVGVFGSSSQEKCDVSSAQTTGVHNITNFVDLGEHCSGCNGYRGSKQHLSSTR